MSEIVVYAPAGAVDVRDGSPPVDQSAQVAQLTADLAAMTADRDAWRTKYEATLPPPVEPPRIIGFVATPDTIDAGQSTTLTATLQNVANAKLNGEPIGIPADGLFATVVNPPTSRSYVLDVVGLDGSMLTSVTVAVTVHPIVVEPPPPPVAGAENPLLIYDSTPGLTRDSLYLKIVNWANKGGDWTDAEGTAQGAVPFASAPVAKGRTDPVRLDAGALVRTCAAGDPVQVCIRASAIMSFRSRAYGPQGPTLEVTYADGETATLYAVADAESNVSTAYEIGGNPSLGLSYSNKAYVRFPAPAKPVAAATLVLTPNVINESGRVDLFRFAVHMDKLGIVQPYAPMTDTFIDTECFARDDVPYPVYARIFGDPKYPRPNDPWNQCNIVDVEGGGKALQVTFDPRGSFALSASVPFPGHLEADEAEWEFEIRLMPDMLTGMRDGFKLFAGVSSCTKSDDAYFASWSGAGPDGIGRYGTLLAGNGGSKAHGNDGWSLRFDSWNTPPVGHPMHGRYLPMQYAYHPEQYDYYGDGWSYSGQNTAFLSGQWHKVRQRAKVNTVRALGLGQYEGVKDAEFDAWLDGLPVLRKRDFRLRTTLEPLIGQQTGKPGSAPYYCVQNTKLAIGRIWLNSYHGGTTTPISRCSFQVRNFRARKVA